MVNHITWNLDDEALWIVEAYVQRNALMNFLGSGTSGGSRRSAGGNGIGRQTSTAKADDAVVPFTPVNKAHGSKKQWILARYVPSFGDVRLREQDCLSRMLGNWEKYSLRGFRATNEVVLVW